MMARLGVVAILLGSLLAVGPLANAFPSDPLWIPGIYDDDDNDNAIDLASFGLPGINAPEVDAGRPLLIVVVRLAEQNSAAAPEADLRSFHSRAPPVA